MFQPGLAWKPRLWPGLPWLQLSEFSGWAKAISDGWLWLGPGHSSSTRAPRWSLPRDVYPICLMTTLGLQNFISEPHLQYSCPIDPHPVPNSAGTLNPMLPVLVCYTLFPHMLTTPCLCSRSPQPDCAPKPDRPYSSLQYTRHLAALHTFSLVKSYCTQFLTELPKIWNIDAQ